MRRRFVIDFRLILPVIFERLPEPLQRFLHVALAECFTHVQAQRGQCQRLAGRLAQSFNLHSIDVEVLADDEIQAHAAGNIGQLGAQVRIAAGAKQFSQACALGFHGKWLAGLDRQLGRILFQYRAGFRDHAHGDDSRRLTGKTVLRGYRACAEQIGRRQPDGEPCEEASIARHHLSQERTSVAQPSCLSAAKSPQ